MTEQEKRKVIDLHKEGKSYSVISCELNISINTIKSFMARRNRKEKHFCRQCHKPVMQMPHRKTKKFCSNSCRMKWWRKHSDEMNRNSFKIVKCPICHVDFQIYSTRQQTYCSRDCYIKARYGGNHG